MAAALLAEGRTTLRAVPDILDVASMGGLLESLGCTVTRSDDVLEIDVPARPRTVASYELMRRLRASFTVLGPLLARCGVASVALPGGDAIGSRGVDLHLSGLAVLGADISSEHGYVIARAPRGLTGALVELVFPSVGATENILMAAVLARGTTVIDNAAREPEIVDLAGLLGAMGARVQGAGTSTIEVVGVDELHPVDHTTVPDRIVAGTYLIAAAASGGDVVVEACRPDHLELVLDTVVQSGASVAAGPDWVRVHAQHRPRAVDVVTLPYPGFPTDLQPMIIALAAVADGTSMITENVYDGRFNFVNEMVRLGADIRTDGQHAVIRGREVLSGAPVVATDIRAGAGLVVAALVAEGTTTIADVHHIDRGYARFVEHLQALGADISR
jgi:UDP-N-acetylglucosamine 1-carboxyvinyltransferase